MTNPIPGADSDLPPVPGHPESRTFRWSELEIETIKRYGLACIAIGRGAAVRDYVSLGAAAKVGANVAAEINADIKSMIQLADKVGRSRQSNNYAMNSQAVKKLVDLEISVSARVSAIAAGAPAETLNLSDKQLQILIEAVGQARNQQLSTTGTLMLVRRTLAAQPSPAPIAGDVEKDTAIRFADHIINGIFEGGDWDGDEVQELAVKYGLLVPQQMEAPCSDEGCQCAQNGAEFPVICYRKTYLAAMLANSSSGEAG